MDVHTVYWSNMTTQFQVYMSLIKNKIFLALLLVSNLIFLLHFNDDCFFFFFLTQVNSFPFQSSHIRRPNRKHKSAYVYIFYIFLSTHSRTNRRANIFLLQAHGL